MIYSYKCPKCGKEQDAVRSVDERDNAPICVHKGLREGVKTTRLIARGVQITAMMIKYDDGNKMPWLDSIDRKNFRKQAEKEYDHGWQGSPDPDLAPAPKTRMRELLGAAK